MVSTISLVLCILPLIIRLPLPSEPCIRGHRSSKCQHFDRLMIKVPKAGRPLMKCPHPKGTCSCQKLYAFMIRIPKGTVAWLGLILKISERWRVLNL